MRKFLSTIFILITLTCYANEVKTIYFDGGYIEFTGGYVYNSENTSEFALLMTEKYFEVNPYLDESFKEDVSEQLLIFLDKNYQMPDGSSNLYERFGDKTDAGWFTLARFKKDSSGVTGSNIIVEFADTEAQWICEDSVYNNRTMPAHPTTTGDFWIFLSVNDPLNVLNLHSYNNDFMYGSPLFLASATNLYNTYIYESGYSGVFPEINSNVLYRIYAQRNVFDSLSTFNNFLKSPNLTQLYFYNNNLDKEDIGKALYEIYNSFRNQAPVKDLEVRLDNMVAPVGGTNNFHCKVTEEMFVDEGYVYTCDVDPTAAAITPLQPLQMTLPDTMFIRTGKEYIYDDILVTSRNVMEAGYKVEYKCSIGSKETNLYKFNEAVADTGFYSFEIVAVDANSNRFDSISSVIRLFEPLSSTADTVTGVTCGDSKFASGVQAIRINSQVSGKYLKTIGTRDAYTSINKTEGWSGQTAQWMVENNASPFVFSGVFDFNQYRAVTLGEANPIDFFFYKIGINDIANENRDTTWIKDNLLPDIETMVAGALSDGTKHVIICLEDACKMDKYRWDTTVATRGDQDYHIERMHFIWKKLVITYAGGRRADNVYVIADGMQLDSYADYFDSNDAVHPDGGGYNRNGDVMAAIIDWIIKYK